MSAVQEHTKQKIKINAIYAIHHVVSAYPNNFVWLVQKDTTFHNLNVKLDVGMDIKLQMRHVMMEIYSTKMDARKLVQYNKDFCVI